MASKVWILIGVVVLCVTSGIVGWAIGNSNASAGAITVPNVVGIQLSQAHGIVVAAGLSYHDNVSIGGPAPVAGECRPPFVDSQTPNPGTSVVKGSTITLNASPKNVPCTSLSS